MIEELDDLDDLLSDVKGGTRELKNHHSDDKKGYNDRDAKRGYDDKNAKNIDDYEDILQHLSSDDEREAKAHAVYKKQLVVNAEERLLASKQNKAFLLTSSDGKPKSKIELKRYWEQKANDLREVRTIIVLYQSRILYVLPPFLPSSLPPFLPSSLPPSFLPSFLPSLPL